MDDERGERVEGPGGEVTGGAPAPAREVGGAGVGRGPEAAGGKGRALTGRRVLLALLLLAVLAAPLLYLRHRRALLGGLKAGADRAKEVLTGQPAAPRDPYAEAVLEAEADRGEPAGRKAQIEVPAELKQYKEARRFLAIQGAAAAEAGVKSPHDFAELAEMIRGGRELVEVPRLGRGYILYGVGLTATGALTHYDLKGRKNVPLFAGVEELKAFEAGLAEERARLSAELKEREEMAKGLGRGERDERARLLAEAAARKKDLARVGERAKLLAEYYGPPGGKERARAGEKFFAEYAVLAGLARDFGGRAYDLNDPASAREFQARMLSYVRPATLSVLEELAASYQSKFERPLPVTSLVRTEEYQRLLRESGNPNAADVAPPPHTTGFAFDVYYRYMTAAEQEFVMSEVARLEREGRVEALRELRDHYHIFVFSEGRRPVEASVDRLLGRRGGGAKAETKEREEPKPAKKESSPKKEAKKGRKR